MRSAIDVDLSSLCTDSLAIGILRCLNNIDENTHTLQQEREKNSSAVVYHVVVIVMITLVMNFQDWNL